MPDKITFIIWFLCVIRGVCVSLYSWVVLYLNSMFVVISDKSHDDDKEATTTNNHSNKNQFTFTWKIFYVFH